MLHVRAAGRGARSQAGGRVARRAARPRGSHGAHCPARAGASSASARLNLCGAPRGVPKPQGERSKGSGRRARTYGAHATQRSAVQCNAARAQTQCAGAHAQRQGQHANCNSRVCGLSGCFVRGLLAFCKYCLGVARGAAPGAASWPLGDGWWPAPFAPQKARRDPPRAASQLARAAARRRLWSRAAA